MTAHSVSLSDINFFETEVDPEQILSQLEESNIEFDYADKYELDDNEEVEGVPIQERLGKLAEDVEYNDVMVARQNGHIHYLLGDRTANEYLEENH